MNNDIKLLDPHTRVRIDPTIVPVIVDKDEVHLRAGPWAGPIVTIQDESHDGTLAATIKMFDSGASIIDVLETVENIEESDVRKILAKLYSKNLLRKIDGNIEREPSPLPLRFSRRDLDELSSKSVLAVTSGNIGPNIVDKLARAGVGKVHVRHRQNDGTGDEFTSADEVETWEDKQTTSDVIETVDVIVTATQQPWSPVIKHVNELAVETGTPLACTEFTGYDVIVGPIIIPGETACYECYRHRRNNNIGLSDTYMGFEQSAVGGNNGLTDRLPFTDIATGFLVTDIINLLCYGHGYTVGSIISFDMSSLTMSSNDVLRLPRCEVCSEVAETISLDSIISPNQLIEK